MTMIKIRAGRLGLDHIGKTVTVTQDGTTLTGKLHGIGLLSDLIDDTQFGDNGQPRWAVGDVDVTLTVASGLSVTVNCRDIIEVEA